MKKLLALFMLLSFPAAAASFPPPGADGQITYNKNGNWGALAIGRTISTSAVNGINTIDRTNPPEVAYTGTSTTVDCVAVRGGYYKTSNVSAKSIVLPAASSSGCSLGFEFYPKNTGAAATYTVDGGGTINGSSSLVIPINNVCDIYTDGTNYQLGGCWLLSGSAAAGGSSGQVQYNNAGSLAGSANFFWDNTNTFLGIGTNVPTTALTVIGTATATALVGSGSGITALNASNIASGTIPTARLGSGTANSSTFLRGDQTYATPAGGGNVTGPVSSTTNAVARYTDGTGAALSNSGVLIDGSNNVSGVVTLASAAHTITSAAAAALAVGANGATNPVIAIDASTSSVATGIVVKGAATGGTTSITAIDSGSNTNISLLAKGTGAITIGSSGSGDITLNFSNNNNTNINQGGNTILQVRGYGIAVTPKVSSTASNVRLLFTPSADTALSASTSAPLSSFAGGGVVRQWTTGSLTTQTDYNFGSPTIAFVGASTITNAGGIGFTLPGCGTNATCTNISGIYHSSTALTATGTITNSYAVNVAADTGATNNFAARFVGPVVNTATITTGGYTVSTLPSGTIGMRAYVTDQTTACPAAGGALTGSGAIVCPVFYNGSAWVGD